MLHKIVTFFTNLALKYGPVGIFLGMMAESVGIPGTASVLDLTSGILIKNGKASFLEIVFISSIGLTLGSVISYSLGYLFGEPLAEKFFKRLGREKAYDKAKEFIKGHGDVAVFLAQFHGTTRTWISLPAGIFKMNLWKFTLYTFLGGIIYCTLITTASYFFYSTIKKFYHQFVQFVHIPFWLGILSLPAIILMLIVIIKYRHRKV